MQLTVHCALAGLTSGTAGFSSVAAPVAKIDGLAFNDWVGIPSTAIEPPSAGLDPQQRRELRLQLASPALLNYIPSQRDTVTSSSGTAKDWTIPRATAAVVLCQSWSSVQRQQSAGRHRQGKLTGRPPCQRNTIRRCHLEAVRHRNAQVLDMPFANSKNQIFK